MRAPAFRKMLVNIWVLLATLSVACCGFKQAPSLIGTVVYDDSNTRAREELVPLKAATVFVTVSQGFQPPDTYHKSFSAPAANQDTPEGRRAKAYQDLMRARPEEFHWEDNEPFLPEAAGQLFRTQIDQEGRFYFDALPPGRHILTVLYWPVRGDPASRRSMPREVTVTKGLTTEIDVKLTRHDIDSI